MTIAFIPGDVNPKSSIAQIQWKNHSIVAYGSGNNLIVTTVTHNGAIRGDLRHLQTIYLENDPLALAISSNGIIAVGSATKITVFRPANEYMSIPQWEYTHEFDVDSQVQCLEWASLESELVVGTQKLISLVHIQNDWNIDWNIHDSGENHSGSHLGKPSPSHSENHPRDDSTHSIGNSSTTNSKSLSNSYHDSNSNNKSTTSTLSTYPLNLFSTVRWSSPTPTTLVKVSPSANRIVSVSRDLDNLVKVWSRISYGENTLFEMTYLKHPLGEYVTHIQLRHSEEKRRENVVNLSRNQRFLDHNDVSHVVYTFTSANTLSIWATYEFNGHAHIKCWKQQKVDGDVAGMVIVEGEETSRFDTFIVALRNGTYSSFTINNITQSPPNNIQIVLNRPITPPRHSFPSHLPQPSHDPLSENYTILNYPVSLLVAQFERNISLVIHDRTKNTLRCCLLKKDELPRVQVKLMNKYQGHTKSIRALVKSSDNQMLLSTSNFGRHNYLWKPFHINERDILLNKVCVIDTGDKGRIVNAMVLKMGGYVGVFLTSEGWICLVGMDGYEGEFRYCEKVRQDQNEVKESTKLSNGYENGSTTTSTTTTANSTYPNSTYSNSTYSNYSNFDRSLSSTPSLASYAKSFFYSDSTITAVFEDVTISWKLTDDSLLRLEEVSSSPVLENPFKKWVATIDKLGLVTVKVISDGTIIHTFATHVENALFLRFTHDKVAIVDQKRTTIMLWNVKLGTLEYEETFEEPIKHLRWDFLEDSNTVLAIGFTRCVYLYVQLRYDYTNHVPNFARIKKIDLSLYTSHEIGDLVWLNQFMIIGCGNQFFIDDKWVLLGSEGNFVDATIKELMVGFTQRINEKKDEGISGDSSYHLQDNLVFDINYLARVLNGPLPLYHPQFLIQALFMGEVEMVKGILVRLFKYVRLGEELVWNLGITPEELFHRKVQETDDDSNSLSIFTKFDAELGELLREKLTKITLPLLTRHQQSTLAKVVQITQYLLKYTALLDANGLRFLIGFQLCINTKKPLTMRDVSWALHLENRDLLVGIVEETFGAHKLRWEHIRRFRMMYWVGTDDLRRLVERANKNSYAELRDPSGVFSLLYLLLRKKQVLVELWKLSTIEEKDKIAAFLKKDFSEKRWQLAATKNAFVLLGKHRWIDALYFFLLGGAIKDCCMVLCNKLQDEHLAIAVAKMYDSNEMEGLLERVFIPKALEEHDRWLTSWILWLRNEKEASVQALIKSPDEMFPVKLSSDARIVHFLQDDPLLVILFRELRTKKISYWLGATQIAPQQEFDFIVRVCGIYARMGCEYLSVLLLATWVFGGEKKVVEEEKVEKVSMKMVAPPPEVFQEPDMSAFDFGF